MKNNFTQTKDDLVIGKDYYFDGQKTEYGTLIGFDDDDDPYFKPIVNMTYMKLVSKKYKGFIGFSGYNGFILKQD